MTCNLAEQTRRPAHTAEAEMDTSSIKKSSRLWLTSFFVSGLFLRTDYGGAPLIHLNEFQSTSIEPPPWLKTDVALFEKLLGIGFFHYGPRLWMVGEIEPLKALQESAFRLSIVERIVSEYPTRQIEPTLSFF